MVPANQWQDRTAVRWELNMDDAGFGDWLDPLEYVQWLFEDSALLCAVPCRVCWWKASFWRCLSLWIVVTWLFVVLCCLRLSVFFSYHSALVLVFFSVFLLVYPFQDDDVYCPVQSSLRLFVRSSHVWSVYCMHYNCQQFTRRFAVPEYVWTDRQLSCNGSRSYSSMAWNFLPEYDNVCHVVCVCVLIPPLCFPLSKIHTHTYTVFLFLFQPMHEWMSWQRASYDMTDSRSMTNDAVLVCAGSWQYSVKNRQDTVHIYRRSEWQHHHFSLHSIGATQLTHRNGRKGRNYCDDSIAATAVPTVFTSRSTTATMYRHRQREPMHYRYSTRRLVSSIIGVSILTYSGGLPATLQRCCLLMKEEYYFLQCIFDRFRRPIYYPTAPISHILN